MTSLLLVVFVLQLAIYVINTIGVASISELAWLLYNKLPTPTSSTVEKSKHQKKELFGLKSELSHISAQDDFARWAKLRRQHDKAAADYERTTSSLASAKAHFNTLLSTTRWAGTNGLRLLLQFWFAKQPMFWIPPGWLPYYVEWILSFPRAPLGGVSIQIWAMACGSVIALGAEAVEAAAMLVSRKETPPQAQAVGTEPIEEDTSHRKKEL